MARKHDIMAADKERRANWKAVNDANSRARRDAKKKLITLMHNQLGHLVAPMDMRIIADEFGEYLKKKNFRVEHL